MSDLTTLSEQSGFPPNYLTFLKDIQNGETLDYSDEDALEAEELDAELRTLEIDED